MRPAALEAPVLLDVRQRRLLTRQAFAVSLRRALPSLRAFAPKWPTISRRAVRKTEFLMRINSGCLWGLPCLKPLRAWHRAWRCFLKRRRARWVLDRFISLAPAPWMCNCRRPRPARVGPSVVAKSAGSTRSHGVRPMTNWTRTCRPGWRVSKNPTVCHTVVRQMTPSGCQGFGGRIPSYPWSNRRCPWLIDEPRPHHRTRSFVQHAGGKSSSDGRGVGTRTLGMRAPDSRRPNQNGGRRNSDVGLRNTSVETSNSHRSDRRFDHVGASGIHQWSDLNAAGMADCEPPSEHAAPRSGNRAERGFRVDFGPCANRRLNHH